MAAWYLLIFLIVYHTKHATALPSPGQYTSESGFKLVAVTTGYSSKTSGTLGPQQAVVTIENELSNRVRSTYMVVTESTEVAMNVTENLLLELAFPTVKTGNTSYGNDTRSADSSASTIPTWSLILNVIQSIISSLGFVANFITLITFQCYPDNWGEKILIILTNQSIADCLLCLCSVLRTSTKHMWTTGNHGFDVFICYFWHSGFLYRYLTTISAYSLILMAIDRFYSFVCPLKYVDFTKGKIKMGLVIVYLWGWPLLVKLLVETKFEEGQCVTDVSVVSFIPHMIWSILTWLAVHMTPLITLLVLHARVIHAFRHRIQSDLPHSSLIERAAKLVTLSSMVIIGIFIITFSYINIFYILSNIGLIPDDLVPILLSLAYFLAAINSAANPFIYALMVPRFRCNLTKLFSLCNPTCLQHLVPH